MKIILTNDDGIESLKGIIDFSVKSLDDPVFFIDQEVNFLLLFVFPVIDIPVLSPELHEHDVLHQPAVIFRKGEGYRISQACVYAIDLSRVKDLFF